MFEFVIVCVFESVREWDGEREREGERAREIRWEKRELGKKG